MWVFMGTFGPTGLFIYLVHTNNVQFFLFLFMKTIKFPTTSQIILHIIYFFIFAKANFKASILCSINTVK